MIQRKLICPYCGEFPQPGDTYLTTTKPIKEIQCPRCLRYRADNEEGE